MEEKLKELQEKGIISFSEWERISEHMSKAEVRTGNTKIDLFLIDGNMHYKIGDMRFFCLKEIKIETETELFSQNLSGQEKLYLVFANHKDEPIAYIPLEESEAE